jgi:hypothetical protein
MIKANLNDCAVQIGFANANAARALIPADGGA